MELQSNRVRGCLHPAAVRTPPSIHKFLEAPPPPPEYESVVRAPKGVEEYRWRLYEQGQDLSTGAGNPPQAWAFPCTETWAGLDRWKVKVKIIPF